MYLASTHLGQVTKFDTKMQCFKCVLELTYNWRMDWTIYLFFRYWLSHLVLSNDSKNVRYLVVQMALKQLFFTKNYLKSSSRWECRSQAPVCDTFGFTGLLATFPNLNIFWKHILTFGLSSPPFSKILIRPTRQPKPRLLIFHSTVSLSHKNSLRSKNSADVIS